MPFKSKSIDWVIEKGTIDALICGQDNTLPLSIMKEMARIARRKIFFITHGGPHKRRFLFEGMAMWNVLGVKQPLSSESDLINCIRSTLKDKPMQAILNDKEALVKAMVECELKSQEQRGGKEEVQNRVCRCRKRWGASG